MTAHKSQYRRGVRAKAGAPTPAPTAAEMREKEILRITRRVHALTQRRRKLDKERKALTKELRVLRRGLKRLIVAPLPPEFEFDSGTPPPRQDDDEGGGGRPPTDDLGI